MLRDILKDRPSKTFIIFSFFILSLLFVWTTAFAGEYSVEEGGQCEQASDCAVEVCKAVDCVDYQCVYTDEPNGTSCDDGLICTENDSCQSAVCSGQPVDTNDGIDCTIDNCDETNGVTHTSDNSLCEEGEFCDPNSGCWALTCNNDGVKDSYEECDGTDFGNYSGTCLNYNKQYSSGDLVCDAECGIDTSNCLAGACGDGIINNGEGCDDGDTDSGDGCSSGCQTESNWTCSGEPSTCSYSEPGGSGGGGGGGGAVSDSTPPSISEIKISVGSTSASISWKTNESSLSWVIYGLTTNYGKEVKTSNYKTSHLLMIPGLSPITTYYYKVKSKDTSGNVGFSINKIFTTLKEGEEPTGQMTIEELKKKIAEILALIAQLKAQLAQLQGGVVIPVSFKFEKNLGPGQTLEDVRYLQIFLNSDPDTQLKPKVAGSFGSSGNESNYFGNVTADAVMRFQEKYSQDILEPWAITKGTGFVGKTTRLKINELLGK